MKIIRMDQPDAQEALSGLRAALGLDEGLVADWQKKISDGSSPLQVVRQVIDDVRQRGDQAVADFTDKFDRTFLTADKFRVPQQTIDEAVKAMPPKVIEAMKQAAENIRRFQKAMLARDPQPLDVDGRRLAMLYRPLRRVGVYIPGGATSYPSSVLMNAVPAQVAGVEQIALVSPPTQRGEIRMPVLAACGVIGVTEVYRIGGAQSIAALAFGTATIPQVDKIVGPGNQFVQLAKKEVLGQVDIDMFAGPSEVLVIADSSANPRHIAADLLSQAEHNPGCCILVTDDPALLERIENEMAVEMSQMMQADIVRDAVERFSALVLVRNMDEACEVANYIAPEHLQIVTRDARGLLPKIRAAGAVFLGHYTPVAVGDYMAGPSHTLPTGGTARFASGLSANDFCKRMSVIEYSPQALADDAPAITALADQEAFEAHRRSVIVRLQGNTQG